MKRLLLSGAALTESRKRKRDGWTDFRCAFSHFWSIVGVIGTGVAVLSWLAHGFRWDLGFWSSEVLRGYRMVFHGAIDLMFGWANIVLPSWTKDLCVAYFVMGAVVARSAASTTAFFLVESHESPNKSYRIVYALFQLVFFLIWPAMLVMRLRRPILLDIPGVFIGLTTASASATHRRDPDILWIDFRRVFAFQALAVLAVVAVGSLAAAIGI